MTPTKPDPPEATPDDWAWLGGVLFLAYLVVRWLLKT